MDSGPSIQKVIEDSIQNQLTGLHTSFPAKVVRVNTLKGHCDVQPLIKRKYANETVVDLPVITNVPVAYYRAGTAFISLPLKVGDTVLVIVSERSIDLWKTKGKAVDPLDPRKFHLSDAVAYPGVYPFTDPPVGVSATDIVIKNANSKISIKSNGKYLFEGVNVELMDVLVNVTTTLESLINALATATAVGVTAGAASVPLSSAATIAPLVTQIALLKTSLSSLKG